jgi:alanine dehydrogenase
MSSLNDSDKEIAKRERAVSALAKSCSVSKEEVRGLFSDELTRLKHGATIHTYLHVLAMASVRATLRQRQATTKAS